MNIINALTILAALGYIGNVAFVIGGVIAAKKKGLGMWTQFWSGLATFCFGGIFMRDLGMLRTVPSIFGSPLEIAATAAVGIITIAMLKSWDRRKNLSNPFTAVLCFTDSIGIAGFAAFGYGRGITAGAPWYIALACAFVTACGGGIIAAVIRAAAAKDWRHFTGTLAGNKFYYLFGAFMSVAYGVLYAIGRNTDFALIVLTVIAVVIGFMVERAKSARGRRGTRRPPQSKNKTNKK